MKKIIYLLCALSLQGLSITMENPDDLDTSFEEFLNPDQAAVQKARNRAPKKCEVCNKDIPFGNLKRHMRTHTGEKPFSCKICNFNTSDASTLREHFKAQRHRDNVKSLSNTSLNLETDIPILNSDHLDELCLQGDAPSAALALDFFTQKLPTLPLPIADLLPDFQLDTSALDVPTHALPADVNSSDKQAFRKYSRNVVCTICQKKWQSLSALKMHMVKHTGEKPYQCEQCGIRVSQQGALNRHIKKVHGTTNSKDQEDS